MLVRAVLAAAFLGIAAPVLAEPENTQWPNYQEGDFVLNDYKFASRESLSQLKLHYRTLGTAKRNAAAESSTACCCCRATPAPAPTGCVRP